MTPNPPDDAPARPGVVVVPVPADAAGRAALTARMATLTRVRHPHLVSVVEVQAVRDGALDVVHARDEAADLPAVLGVRGRLAPAEAAAVGVHVAQALAALHAAGLLHGPLEPADVVLRPDGSPALRPRAVVPPEEWTPAEDVRAAARLVAGLLGSPPVAGAPPALAGDPVADPEGALRRVLADSLGPDARRRPEAGTLAALVDAACEPASLRLPDPATLAGAALASRWRSSAEPEEVGRSRTARRFRGARAPGERVDGVRGGKSAPAPGGLDGRTRAATRRTRTAPPWWRELGPRPVGLRPALVIVGIGLTVGVMTGAALELRDRGAWGAEDGATAVTAHGAAPASSPASPTDADATLDQGLPAAAATALTQRRLDLLAGDLDDVGAVDIVGSPAHAADTALLERLRATGVRPEGPRATVTDAAVVAADARTASVRVEYVVEGHEQVAGDGARTTVAATGPQRATLELQWTDEGWRVRAVA